MCRAAVTQLLTDMTNGAAFNSLLLGELPAHMDYQVTHHACLFGLDRLLSNGPIVCPCCTLFGARGKGRMARDMLDASEPCEGPH